MNSTPIKYALREQSEMYYTKILSNLTKKDLIYTYKSTIKNDSSQTVQIDNSKFNTTINPKLSGRIIVSNLKRETKVHS